MIFSKFMPIVARHAISGRAYVNSEDPIFNEPLAHARCSSTSSPSAATTWPWTNRFTEIPERVDLKTGVITRRAKTVYRIHIFFEASKIRRG